MARTLNDGVTHKELRRLACAKGKDSPQLFEGFFAISGGHRYEDAIAKLEQDKVWDVEIGDVALMMLQAALGVRILVLRSCTRPHMFPEDGRGVDDRTVVIVQDQTRSHYDATRLVYNETGKKVFQNVIN